MQKTKIEWCDHSINPIKGICKMGCDYCYAIRMYQRFRWNPEIRFDSTAFRGIENIQEPSKMFVCSTHDMFGSWIPTEWIADIIAVARGNPKHTFIFLTKNPQNAGKYLFPKNVWLGVTVESQNQVWRIKTLLQPEIKANLKFVSFEPLQGEINCNFNNYRLGADNQKISWFIIGAETGNRINKIKPRPDWINHLLYQHADTPAFVKNNCLDYMWKGSTLYQEYPKGVDSCD